MRNGTYRADRHGVPRPGDIVTLKQREAPASPGKLSKAGLELWNDLWTHMPNVGPLERTIIETACMIADQHSIAYADWLRNRNPATARAMYDAQKSLRQQLALLGLSAKDRQAMLARKPPESSIDALKRKVVELKRVK